MPKGDVAFWPPPNGPEPAQSGGEVPAALNSPDGPPCDANTANLPPAVVAACGANTVEVPPAAVAAPEQTAEPDNKLSQRTGKRRLSDSSFTMHYELALVTNTPPGDTNRELPREEGGEEEKGQAAKKPRILGDVYYDYT